LPHYIEALKQRFIIRTDERTAQVRTHFLRGQIEHLELGKQYQVLLNDLRAMEAEQEVRLLRIQAERRDLQVRGQQSEALDELRLQKERLAIELEIEQLKSQKQAIGKVQQPEERLTPEQQRRLKRMEIEERIERLDRQEEAALRKARDDGDRIRIQNMYADKRGELRDELAKYLA
jgi:hypothetical protein